ncbi:MAG TPA: calcium-binding protein [Coleofasciculaceae cyanobacterium]
MAVLSGTLGDDNLIGTNVNDVIFGGLGNDRLDGGFGIDTVSYAGFGSNIQASLESGTATFPGGTAILISIENLSGGNGDDILTGNFLDNILSGNGGNDRLLGLGGNDTLDGGAGFDSLSGGLGNDRLSGGADNDALNGDEGNDTLLGGDGNDVLDGGDGNDLVVGNKGNDTMIGGAGNDSFEWVDGDGSDVIQGGTGTDNLLVNGSITQGDQFTLRQSAAGVVFERTNLVPITLTIREVETFQAINGLGGDDVFVVQNLSVSSGISAIQFTGGDGNDRMSIATNTNTRIDASGGNGNDIVMGGAVSDKLFGDTGNDTLAGGGGSDTLTGVDTNFQGNLGRGEIDILVGGAGADRFVVGINGKVLYDDGNNLADGDARNFFDGIDGTGDFARIVDFKRSEDVIQLAGSANQYVLKPINNSLRGGTAQQDIGIFRKNGPTLFQPDELLAIVQDAPSLNLNSAQFSFVK